MTRGMINLINDDGSKNRKRTRRCTSLCKRRRHCRIESDWMLSPLWLGRCAVFLRGVAHNQADHRAGKHDLQIIAMLHESDDPGQQCAYRQAEHNAERE